MRQNVALFFVGLICLSSVAALNQDVVFLKSLKSSEFGSTLYSSIQVELKSGTSDSVDKILDLLKQIADQIVADQKADDTQIAEYRKTTLAEIAKLNAEVKDLTQRIASDRNLIKLNDAAIVVAQGIIKVEKKHRAGDIKELAENRGVQNETTRVYKETFAKLTGYVTGLNAAKTSLNNYADGQSFIELTQGVNNLKFDHPKYQGFMNILSEMLSSSEKVHGEARFKAVMTLIDRVTDQLIKDIEILTRVYKRRMADLRVVESRLIQQIATHTQNIAQQEMVIGQKKQSTAQANNRITNNSQRKSEAIQEAKDLTTSLANANAAYAKRTAERKEESAIIARVQVIFRTRLTDEVRSSVTDLTN